MPIIFETGALLRALFTASDFVPTGWEPVQAKADFANKLSLFIAADFKESLFTKGLYHRLHMTFGLIAHYNREGFFGTYFQDLSGKVQFLEDLLQWPCFGDPTFTYSDVEQAIRRRLRQCDLLAAYRALQAAEIERQERETLRRLAAKYHPAAEGEIPAPSPPRPLIIAPAAPRKPRAAAPAAAQAMLF